MSAKSPDFFIKVFKKSGVRGDFAIRRDTQSIVSLGLSRADSEKMVNFRVPRTAIFAEISAFRDRTANFVKAFAKAWPQPQRARLTESTASVAEGDGMKS